MILKPHIVDYLNGNVGRQFNFSKSYWEEASAENWKAHC